MSESFNRLSKQLDKHSVYFLFEVRNPTEGSFKDLQLPHCLDPSDPARLEMFKRVCFIFVFQKQITLGQQQINLVQSESSLQDLLPPPILAQLNFAARSLPENVILESQDNSEVSSSILSMIMMKHKTLKNVTIFDQNTGGQLSGGLIQVQQNKLDYSIPHKWLGPLDHPQLLTGLNHFQAINEAQLGQLLQSSDSGDGLASISTFAQQIKEEAKKKIRTQIYKQLSQLTPEIFKFSKQLINTIKGLVESKKNSAIKLDFDQVAFLVIKELLQEGTLNNVHVNELIQQNKVQTLEELNDVRNFVFNSETQVNTSSQSFQSEQSFTSNRSTTSSQLQNQHSGIQMLNSNNPESYQGVSQSVQLSKQASEDKGKVEIVTEGGLRRSTDEIVLFQHYNRVLLIYFKSFKKANIDNMKKAKSLIGTICNFSANEIQSCKKKGMKNQLSESEMSFIETYNKHSKQFDEIVAVNVMLYLMRHKLIGLTTVSPNAQVVHHPKEQEVINQVDKLGVPTDELKYFVGAYYLIKQVQNEPYFLDKLVKKDLQSSDQRLSLDDKNPALTQKLKMQQNHVQSIKPQTLTKAPSTSKKPMGSQFLISSQNVSLDPEESMIGAGQSKIFDETTLPEQMPSYMPIDVFSDAELSDESD